MSAIKIYAVIFALFVVTISSVRAGDGSCCDCCGCGGSLHRVCIPKRIEKEVTKICWDVKCEDVCIPGRSTKCGTVCKEDACGCWSFILWEPNCARVKTRHVPLKTEVKRKVPAIQWVVEYRCDACCQLDTSAAPAPIPQPVGSPQK